MKTISIFSCIKEKLHYNSATSALGKSLKRQSRKLHEIKSLFEIIEQYVRSFYCLEKTVIYYISSYCAICLCFNIVFGCSNNRGESGMGDRIDVPPKGDNLLLVKGIMSGDAESVKKALLNGADPNFKFKKRPVILLIDQAPVLPGNSFISRDGSGGMYVHLKNHKNIIKLLMAHGANLNVIDDSGWTPLKQAKRHNEEEIVEILKENGAKN